MWAITNYTPYKVESTWGRDKDGVHEWIVAVKGTFDIKPNGSLRLADEQLEPLLLPEYNGEAGISSLRYDADLVAPKPTTDVLLNGTAYAPKGRPSTDFLVSLRVGRVHKVIRVIGNRRWKRGLFGCKPSKVEPITELPIIYERSYGGYDQTDPDPKHHRLDPRNPVGCGVVAKSNHRLGQPLPNFQYPKGSIEKSGPAGFGALDSHWSPRRELNGTYDEAWQKSRFPLLPADWDPRSLLCSPADQRPDRHLRGGEPVELENMTPDGKLRFSLPRIYLRFRTRIDNRTEEHQGRLATVIIEPDHPRVIMVWQTSLAVHTNGDYLDETIVSEKPYILWLRQ
jgi:hypothetical protein